MAYGKAIGTLKTIGAEITSLDQVKGLPGIGDGIQKKVKEYLDNGAFREVVDPFSKDKMQALSDLEKIAWVGPAAALKLYKNGYTSIAKLKKDPSQLTSL